MNFKEKQLGYDEEPKDLTGHDLCDGLANTYVVSDDLVETSKSPEIAESEIQSTNSQLDQSEGSKPQTLEHYEKTSSRSTSHLPKGNADKQNKSESTDTLYLKLAWLDKKYEDKEKLPSIRLVKGMKAERKSV